MSGDTAINITGGTSLGTGWRTVGVDIDLVGETMSLFLDGESDAVPVSLTPLTQAFFDYEATASQDAMIASSSVGTARWNGAIGMVGVWFGENLAPWQHRKLHEQAKRGVFR